MPTLTFSLIHLIFMCMKHNTILEYKLSVVDLAGVCAPPLNLSRGGAVAVQRGCKFFSSVQFYLRGKVVWTWFAGNRTSLFYILTGQMGCISCKWIDTDLPNSILWFLSFKEITDCQYQKICCIAVVGSPWSVINKYQQAKWTNKQFNS